MLMNVQHKTKRKESTRLQVILDINTASMIARSGTVTLIASVRAEDSNL